MPTSTEAEQRQWFLPEPDPRPVHYTVISVDDHLVEPPHLFEGRLPARLQERAPKIVETQDGQQIWEFEGQRFTQSGTNALAGRTRATIKIAPCPFRSDAARMLGHRRPDPRHGHQRHVGLGQLPVADHRVLRTGVSQANDPELGLAVTRAWNDWFYDEWYSAYPDRIIPLGITFLVRSSPGCGRDPA